MGDRSRHDIAVYHLCVSQDIPVCYSKILDVCIVTESKKHGQLQESLFLPEKEKEGEKAQRKREIKLPQITHQLRDVNILVWYLFSFTHTYTGLHIYGYWPRYDFCLQSWICNVHTTLLTCLFFFCVCLQSCPTLCNPMDCSSPASFVHGILQARILEWLAISHSRGSSRPRDQTISLMSPALAGGFFTTDFTFS